MLALAQVHLHGRHGNALLGQEDAHPARVVMGASASSYQEKVMLMNGRAPAAPFPPTSSRGIGRLVRHADAGAAAHHDFAARGSRHHAPSYSLQFLTVRSDLLDEYG
jgi:hypothetical protein